MLPAKMWEKMHILTSSNRVTLCCVQEITVNQNVVSLGIKFLLKNKSELQKKCIKILFHFLSPPFTHFVNKKLPKTPY